MQTQKSEIRNPKFKILDLAIALFAMLLPWPHLAAAQQPRKLRGLVLLGGHVPLDLC